MGIRGIRRLAVATLACLGLAVSLPAAGEDAAQADTLEQGAGSLARDLVDQLLRHTDTHEQRLALQPLEPEAFKGLNEHGRGELHELLVRSLGSEIRDSYRLVNPRRFRDISRMLENSGDSAWFDRYIELLRGAEADISISCKAGAPSKGAIELTCSADTVESFVNRGTARTLLRTDWLVRPVDPSWGLASVAEAIVKHMQGAGNLNAAVVDAQSGEETALSQSIAKRLLDEFHAQKRAWRGPLPVGGSQEAKDYRARGEIVSHEARFELRVELHSPEGVMETTFRESMHWTPDLRRLASGAGAVQAQSSGATAGAGASTGESSIVEMIRRANEEYERKVSGAIARGEFDSAREHVSELEAVIPGSLQVNKLTAMIDEALGAAARAERRALGAVARGDFDAARQHARELASVTPESPRLDEMQREIDQARAAAAVVEQEVLDAVARGDFASALEHVQELADLIPKSPRIAQMKTQVGQVRAEAAIVEHEVAAAIVGGEFETATKYVEELARLTPESPRVTALADRIESVRAEVGRALREVAGAIARGDFEAARKHAGELASATPGSPRVPETQKRIERVEAAARSVEEKVSAAVARGDFEAARRHAAELTDLIPASPRVPRTERAIEQVLAAAATVVQKVRAAVARGELDEARQAVGELADLTPHAARVQELTETIAHVERTKQRVLAAAARGAFEEARALLNELETLAPESPRVPDLAGRVEDVHADARDAEREVLKAIARGTFDEARTHLRALSDVTPESPTVTNLQRSIERAQRTEREVSEAIGRGAFDEARRHVDELAGLTPESPRVAEARSSIERTQADAHRAERMVLAAIRAGEFERARTHVQDELARATPMSPRISEMTSEIERALAAAQRAERLVLTAIGLGELNDARKHLNEALAGVTPDSPRVAELERRIGRMQSAVQRAEQAVSEALERADFEEARRHVKELANLTPKSRHVARLNASIDEAQGSALRSGQLVGEAIERGEFEEARRLVQALAEMAPDSPQVPVMNETIDRALATVRRTEREVAGAIERGEFERSRALVTELAGVIARSSRITELKAEVERARAAVAAAEKNALDAVAKALSAVDRGNHDARIRSVEVARMHVAELGEVSPRSPRVSELEERIDRAELIPAMVRIRPGELKMRLRASGRDDETAGRLRRISSDGFWIGKYEVTFDEYDRFVAETRGRRPRDKGWGRERRPVIDVSWIEANEYVEWLSDKLGERYRLPTAEEWEYAARAGSVTEYPWGEEVRSNRANCKGCGSRWDRRQTAPVGSFSANAWGLHDAVGNVCEWTCSTQVTDHASRTCSANLQWEEEKAARRKGQGADNTTFTGFLENQANSRVCRGGSWKHDGSRKLVSQVERALQTDTSDTIGFRIARD